MVFVLVIVIFLSFALNLFSIISAKQQLDVCADQLTRQIQFSGEVDSDTDKLFGTMCSGVKVLHDTKYTVDTTYHSGKKIQLGTPFEMKVTAKVCPGGFGDFVLFPINLISVGAGVSEEYWK